VIDRRVARVSAVVRNEGFWSREDEVVIEEPLEIRVAGEALAITMRTPADDRALALGFLLAEGVIRNLADVGSVYPCGRPGNARYGNAIDVIPGAGVSLDLDKLDKTRRVGITTSACGVCGRDAIDDLLERLQPNEDFTPIEPALIARATSLLADGQQVFARTGGLHAACAITRQARVVAHAEDVGRHNAVDKVVGSLLLRGQLPRDCDARDKAAVLAVSGRSSFEIVQKAAVAGFVCVVSVSAPSSLAIDTAHSLGITLAAFSREARFSLYSHAERVTGC
jgi:FdhD protein